MNALDRFKILFRRVKNGSIKKMKYFADEIHEETGKSSLAIMADMCWCAAKSVTRNTADTALWIKTEL